MKLTAILVPLAAAGLLVASSGAAAQTPPTVRARPAQTALGTAFTYQGQLSQNGAAVSASCDLTFGLYDALTGGTQIGSTQSAASQAVAQGTFAVALDFGASAFGGEARWIETAVRCPAGSGSYTTLTPRQALTAVPNALHAASAGGLQGRTVASTAPSAGNVLRWDGSQWVPGAAFIRTLVVGPVGTDAQNGTALLAALATIADNASTRPYLLKLEPGTYDLGSSSLQMKQFVDVEGSGEQNTLIKSYGSSSLTTGTVVGASSAELRFVSVTNTGDAPNAVALNLPASARAFKVVASATGGTGANIGVLVSAGSPVLTHVTASAAGSSSASSYGVYASGGSTTVADSDLQATGGTYAYGLYATGATVVVRNTVLTGTNATAINVGAALQSFSSGTFADVQARAAAVQARAFDVQYSSATLDNTRALAEESGGSNTALFVIQSQGTVAVRGSRLVASGGTSNNAIQLSDGSLAVHNSSVLTTGTAILAGATGGLRTINVDGSTVFGSTGLNADSLYTSRIGGSQLSNTAGLGSKTCVNVYTHNYAALNGSCG